MLFGDRWEVSLTTAGFAGLLLDNQYVAKFKASTEGRALQMNASAEMNGCSSRKQEKK